jgi:hypothetical protein
MSTIGFDIPILFLVYNRPAMTEAVFATLRELRPSRLFIAADGPRKHRPTDAVTCARVREIVSRVDWPCEVKTLFREENLGTKYAVSGAIDWFFQQVDAGIVLEDDCLPTRSFYTFCASMLSRYASDERIMHINGTNFLHGKQFRFAGSYYYSKLPHPWGWATWKRAWDRYDFAMSAFERFESEHWISRLSDNPVNQHAYLELLQKTRRGEIDTWDYQWFYSIWLHDGLVITPVNNMVTNLGFGAEATNTTYTNTRLGGMKRHELNELAVDDSRTVNRDADAYAMAVKLNEGRARFLDRIIHKLKSIVSPG